MVVNQKPTSSDYASSLIQAIPVLTIDRPFSLRKIVSRRVKDSDRIAAMATELCKLGSTVDVEGGAGFIRVTRPTKHTPNTVKF